MSTRKAMDVDTDGTVGTFANSEGWHRRTEKVSEVIAREIVSEIVSQGLEPGSRLPSETEMLEAFDVGRSSLREALRILEVHGLIAVKPGRGGGPIVMGASPPHFAKMSSLFFHTTRATYRDLMEARLIIEPMMAGVAAERRDPTIQEPLRDALRLTHAAVDENEGAVYVRAAGDFHSALLSASGNPILDLFGGSLKEIFTKRVSQGLYPESYRSHIADHHQRIADAVTAGKKASAERLMREHMEDYLQQLNDRFPGLLDEIVDW